MGDIFFFGGGGVGIDGGGGELGVTEPFLEEVEGDSGGDGGDAEAVAEAFGGGVGAGEAGGLHDGVDGAPSGHARPGPEAEAAPLAAAGLVFADAVHQVEGVEQGGGNGDGAVDAALAFFQALEDEHAGGEVDAIGGEGQRLGETAAGEGEGHGEGPHLTIGVLGGGEEGVALAPGQVFASTVGIVEPHAAGWRGGIDGPQRR